MLSKVFVLLKEIWPLALSFIGLTASILYLSLRDKIRLESYDDWFAAVMVLFFFFLWPTIWWLVLSPKGKERKPCKKEQDIVEREKNTALTKLHKEFAGCHSYLEMKLRDSSANPLHVHDAIKRDIDKHLKWFHKAIGYAAIYLAPDDGLTVMKNALSQFTEAGKSRKRIRTGSLNIPLEFEDAYKEALNWFRKHLFGTS